MGALKNRVLLVLVIGAVASCGLAFLSVAPNRLVSGIAIPFAQIPASWRHLLFVPAAVLVLGVFLPQRCSTHIAIAVAATVLLFGLVWLAGANASRVSETSSPSTRIARGGGVW